MSVPTKAETFDGFQDSQNVEVRVFLPPQRVMASAKHLYPVFSENFNFPSTSRSCSVQRSFDMKRLLTDIREVKSKRKATSFGMQRRTHFNHFVCLAGSKYPEEEDVWV